MARAHAGLAVPGPGPLCRAGPHARPGGRVRQRHLARLCRRLDRDGAGPLRRLHQPGADAAAEPQPLLRLYDLAANAIGDAPPCAGDPAGSVAAPGVRAGGELRRRPAHAGDDAGGAAGDLHAGRLPRRRALRHRAHRGPASTPAPTTTAPPTTGWTARRSGRAASAPARCSPARSRRRREYSRPAAKGWRSGAARSRATASAGSRRRCSIPTRGSRSRCARRAA